MALSRPSTGALANKKRSMMESLRKDYRSHVRECFIKLIQPFCCKLERNVPYIDSHSRALCKHTTVVPQQGIENQEMLFYASSFLKYMDAIMNYYPGESTNLTDSQKNCYSCIFDIGKNPKSVTLYRSINSIDIDTEEENGRLDSEDNTNTTDTPKNGYTCVFKIGDHLESVTLQRSTISIDHNTKVQNRRLESIIYKEERPKRKLSSSKDDNTEMSDAITSNVGSIDTDVAYRSNKKPNK